MPDEGKGFRCPYCDKVTTLEDLKDHIQEVHQGEPLHLTVKVGQVKWD